MDRLHFILMDQPAVAGYIPVISHSSLRIKPIKNLIVFAFIGLFACSLHAQKISDYYDIQFRKLSTDNILPSNIIAGVVQDKNGFVWISTSNGLARYDGVKVKLFQNIQSDSNSLPCNLIKDSRISANGIIWLGTANGVVKFDPSREKFTDLHKHETFAKFRGYYARLFLDDKERLSCWDMYSKSYIIIDTKTDSLLAVFNEETIGRQNWITGDKRLFFVDQDDFWFSVNNSELIVIHLQNNKISTRNLSNNVIRNISTQRNFNYLYRDKKGNIYCARNGLYVLPEQRKNTLDFDFIDLLGGGGTDRETEFSISSITEDKEGMIWVSAVNNGIREYNPITKEVIVYNTKSANYNGIISTNAYFLNDNSGNLWVVHNNGILQLYDYRTKSFTEFKHEPTNPTSIASDIYGDGLIENLFFDLSGNYWLPTQGNGLVCFSLRKTKFPVIKNLPNNPNSLSSNGIWGIYEDDKGLLWVGVKNSGLNIVDMNTGLVSQYIYNSKPDYSGFTVCADFLKISDVEYLIGCIPFRRFQFDQKTHSLRMLHEFKQDIKDTASIIGWVTTDIFKDRKGDIWVSTFDGLNLYRKPDKNHPYGFFKHYLKNDKNNSPIANDQVWHIMEDNKEQLWLSTADGLSCMNPERTKTINYYHDPQDPRSLSSSNIKFTMQDSKGRIWIATEGGGLNLFVEKENRFIEYNKSTGFPSSNIFAVFEDHSGNLWMSSTDGIIRFNAETNQIYTFTGEDGLPSKQFVAGSFFQNPVTGKIYFGGDHGITHFYPDSIKLSTFIPKIVFESLNIFNNEIEVRKEYNGNVFLTRAISNTEKIILSSRQNVFSIEFAALDYSAAKNIRYSYMLEGANATWIETDADNKTLNYTNLAPGDYKLKVKSTNADGVWCENIKTLTIIVTPPWWNSRLFRVFFLVILITGLILFLRLRINFLKNKNIELENKIKKRTLQLQNANALLKEKNDKILNQNEEIKASQEEIIAQAEHLHHVDQQKLQFLTNISHEFRTPLTLILGPTEKLIDQESSLSTSRKTSLFKMIQRNSLRMLRLVNQVMDMSKVEADEMKLQIINGDIIKHIEPIFESFMYIAERKCITFNFRKNTESINAWFDADKVEKIIYNLLSNAFKFTNPDGKIEVTVEGRSKQGNSAVADEVVIMVEDNGIGIPEEQVKHIFDRFYQVKSNVVKGTGLGLALTRDLVSLMKGSIEVKSVLDQGTCFTVVLPLSEENFINQEIVAEPEQNKVDLLNMALTQTMEQVEDEEQLSTANLEKKSKLPIILIVEDHYDMRKFLADELITEYQIVEASDGAKGIELALEKIPDLIISDLMMPFVDGLTLINTLKKDKHTSHIPIILLTAKVNEESRTEGYDLGADSYISKPFQMPVLKARIKNLLQIRKTLRQRFSSEIALEPKEIVFNSADEHLLTKAIEIIEQNSKNENFNVEKLALALGIHRVQLSRKFLALTNENISDFIRITRLKKAAKLLLSKKFSISEVCYQVGFKDPAHFTRVFSKQFNITPSKYIEESSL
jgi:signal transduction histidine kinase/ligand-binding sensor domain-containing protein/DNA-binding response OmpR family regulator